MRARGRGARVGEKEDRGEKSLKKIIRQETLGDRESKCRREREMHHGLQDMNPIDELGRKKGKSGGVENAYVIERVGKIASLITFSNEDWLLGFLYFET